MCHTGHAVRTWDAFGQLGVEVRSDIEHSPEPGPDPSPARDGGHLIWGSDHFFTPVTCVRMCRSTS